MSYGAGFQEDWEKLLSGHELDGVLAPPSLEDGHFPAHGSFHGDYYRDDDNVTRGVTLTDADLGMAPQPFGKDYAAMGLGMDFDGSLECMDKMGMYDLGLSPPGWGSSASQAPALDSKIGRFQETDIPPGIPQDSFFELEGTTLKASCRLPATLANGVVDFLTTEVVSSITKLCRKKFAIKADVFVKSVMCSIKARVYTLEGQYYALEFQRRSGDARAFKDIFRQVSEYLSVSYDLSGGLPEVRLDLGLPPLLPQSMPDTRQTPDLQPLIDMSASIDMSCLQAEAASALADVAQDKASAASLCTHDTFAQLCKLLQADTFEILYPTARLFAALAELPEADHCFISSGVLPVIVSKLRSEESGDIARCQLAQGFKFVVSRCAPAMGSAAVKELLGIISDALHEMSTLPDKSISRDLSEAEFHLRAH